MIHALVHGPTQAITFTDGRAVVHRYRVAFLGQGGLADRGGAFDVTILPSDSPRAIHAKVIKAVVQLAAESGMKVRPEHVTQPGFVRSGDDDDDDDD